MCRYRPALRQNFLWPWGTSLLSLKRRPRSSSSSTVSHYFSTCQFSMLAFALVSWHCLVNGIIIFFPIFTCWLSLLAFTLVSWHCLVDGIVSLLWPWGTIVTQSASQGSHHIASAANRHFSSSTFQLIFAGTDLWHSNSFFSSLNNLSSSPELIFGTLFCSSNNLPSYHYHSSPLLSSTTSSMDIYQRISGLD